MAGILGQALPRANHEGPMDDKELMQKQENIKGLGNDEDSSWSDY
jgi:hypothetical protein